MCRRSTSKKSQRSTPRVSSCSPPHDTLLALTSPPKINMSVPSFEQTYRTRSRYGPLGLSPSKYIKNTAPVWESCASPHRQDRQLQKGLSKFQNNGLLYYPIIVI
ncbi:hypothetical protein EVAR_103904_1 [Eumeta japonica]|uniref:Uncharacterized protein n=1 Tax=Eumeta variegata TaxID=151549 RepID=A0A4C2AH81_EUMVA|nr:hypothetical protein EVAR_103904_1 [Eumeta japonica]